MSINQMKSNEIESNRIKSIEIKFSLIRNVSKNIYKLLKQSNKKF